MSEEIEQVAAECFLELLPLMCSRQNESIKDWLRDHITSWETTAQLYFTLPRMLSVLFESRSATLPQNGEPWLIQIVSGDPNQPLGQAYRMLVAALNDDTPGLRGMVQASLDSPEDYQVETIWSLINLFGEIYDRPEVERGK